MDSKKIGAKLRELRGDKSATEVATAVGVSTSAVSMYENGERIPRDEVKVKLARYFGVTIQELFFAD